MTTIQRIPGLVLPPSAPLIPVADSILPTAGALVLLDVTNSYYPWPSGVPSNGAYLTNLAQAQARAAIGSPTAEVRPIVELTPFPSAAAGGGLIERTSKGGVHTLLSTTCTTAGAGFGIVNPQAITAFMQANKTHQFYWSQVERTTRAGTVNSSYTDVIATNVSGSVSWAHGFTRQGTVNGVYNLGYVTTDPSGASLVNTDTAVAKLRQVGGNPLPDNFASAAIGNVSAYAWMSGNVGPNPGYNATNNTTSRGLNGSRVFYRCYLEDLTISGRSYASVAALDKSLFQAAFGSGGRFYGDTNTDPATIA